MNDLTKYILICATIATIGTVCIVRSWEIGKKIGWDWLPYIMLFASILAFMGIIYLCVLYGYLV